MDAIDRQSPAWRALKRHIEARIGVIQTMLEQDHDAIATAALRGQIKELRLLIERVEPPVINRAPYTQTSDTPLY